MYSVMPSLRDDVLEIYLSKTGVSLLDLLLLILKNARKKLAHEYKEKEQANMQVKEKNSLLIQGKRTSKYGGSRYK